MDTQKTVVTEIMTYAMMLIIGLHGVIIGLHGVKAERNNTNQSLDLDVPPVLPSVLMKLRHGMFIRKVLDMYHEHFAKFWSPKNIHQIEADHCALLKAYSTNCILCVTIDSHGVLTAFNDAWGCAPGRYECLRSFCDGLATVFANMASVESEFSILKWEMDANHTTLMHLSLKGIFQAK